jgi:hypothetical protein
MQTDQKQGKFSSSMKGLWLYWLAGAAQGVLAISLLLSKSPAAGKDSPATGWEHFYHMQILRSTWPFNRSCPYLLRISGYKQSRPLEK